MQNRWKAVAALVAALVGGPTVAQAQGVNFQGTTSGCFYTGMAAPMSCSGLASSYAGLRFVGSSFNATSNPADGLFTLGDLAGSPQNLGVFTLVGGDANYTGKQFALFINFTAPTQTNAPGGYTAVLTGNLSGAVGGNVFIDFDNSNKIFTFSNGLELVFAVNDLSLNNSRVSEASVSVTGQGYVTPEPASLALVGTGVAGIFGALRRRKASKSGV